VDSDAISKKAEKFGKRVEGYFTRTSTGRTIGYSAAIFWNVALFIFLSFFYKYIAWYHIEADGSVTRLPMLTSDYLSWLPILITALILSIAANILFIIYDKYWLRETIQIILNIIGIAVVIALVSIFPFDFSVIPNSTAVDIVPILVKFVLILAAVGLGIGVLIRFIKLISNATR
jgi:magnesium-transporting ATPase (P-type)